MGDSLMNGEDGVIIPEDDSPVRLCRVNADILGP